MKLKSQKGSITIFVLIALLFYTAFLLLMYAANTNKFKTISEKSEILKGIYEKNTSEESINNIYNRKQKQQMKVNLPSEYQQVEYLESTGTQYIDTGYIANSKTNVNISFAYIENNGDAYSNGMLFGSANNLNGRPSYSIGITKDEKIYYRNSDSAEAFNSDTINKNQIYKVNTFENNIEIDNTEYNNEMNLLSNAQNYSSYLFARHHPGGNDPIARCIF